MGLEQGRLWALKSDSKSDVVFYAVETGLPTLFHRKKDAELFQKRCKAEEIDVTVIEVEIIEKRQ